MQISLCRNIKLNFMKNTIECKKFIKSSKLRFNAIPILFLFIFTASHVFGDGSVTIRSSCSGWQYKSRAYVTKSLVLANSLQTVYTCNPCAAIIDGGQASVSLANCAYQKARYCNGIQVEGKVYKWYCNRGIDNALYSKMLEYEILRGEEEEAWEESNVTTDKVSISDSVIKIPNLNGNISTFGSAMESYLEINVWLENIEEGDTVCTSENLISIHRLSIYEDSLISSGVFTRGDFRLDIDAGVRTVQLEEFDANIKIPEKYALKMDSLNDKGQFLAVTINTHGGEIVSKKLYSIESNVPLIQNEQIQFTVSNSEVEQGYNISFNSISNNFKVVTLYDSNGAIIKKIYDFNLEKGEVWRQSFNTNDLKLNSGVYFFTYDDGENFVVQKVFL